LGIRHWALGTGVLGTWYFGNRVLSGYEVLWFGCEFECENYALRDFIFFNKNNYWATDEKIRFMPPL
jgi:hypothetical protein